MFWTEFLKIEAIKELSFGFMQAKDLTGAFIHLCPDCIPFSLGVYPSSVPH